MHFTPAVCVELWQHTVQKAAVPTSTLPHMHKVWIEDMPESKTHWMIYGAYGYSGRLIATEAVRRGHRPMLAGRDAQRVKALAEELGLAWRVFGLEDVQNTAHALHDTSLVIHCAGPFSSTARPMLEACIQAHAHYLDITGEIDVFELAKSLDGRARTAGVTLCPGTGFDVIPTDCLARKLADQLPDATELDLGFVGGKSLSPGTAKTTIEAMKRGVTIRVDGKLEQRNNGYLETTIDFGGGPRNATPISWGDVSTAYTSTGIPNIRVFLPASKKTIKSMRVANALRPLLRLGVVQGFLKRRLAGNVQGPDAAQREKQRMLVWGEVRNAKGKAVTGFVETPNGYEMTSWGPVLIAEHILQTQPEPGYTTPSLLMGADWLTTLPGVGKLSLKKSATAKS